MNVVSSRWNNIYLHLWGALNVKDIATTGRVAEDARHVEDVAKKDPDNTEEDCSNETKCPDCQETHHPFSRSCDMHKKEREILKVNYKWNVTSF